MEDKYILLSAVETFKSRLEELLMQSAKVQKQTMLRKELASSMNDMASTVQEALNKKKSS
ncbi:Mis6-Sim4 complex subunit Fta6 [Schizosaccharomyces pombe]|uniref:Inner kinetochore subunit fta6 n=1 Tax=Schizosaccharomyces pombe (strain 972 / ATCC 24843) TaxID=284812 RepID=FTA6_SCHPO|nr:Sim4 and Mal2-associated protein 6 [Schizosaccharomyces pombe]Q9UTP3.1 RecName: Full=Inner kinetochore subunit fta6; AltName: Full=Constitutive centromere-associated network protein fta6; AltName: Full=Sim4 complex subunit fta6; AltName: Full=Sim4-mal2-associated protein 6 [Schizosaccharomyces pombe 972h-]CAB59801.1 Sim4 and Mal2 associated (4 and 2 associated) protein 6 [Schizosaccharomyces pombe]|eukprot:NP_594723.1 Sim4 and Mal2-associated protein 6 [Schizosaccharomyces pombe]